MSDENKPEAVQTSARRGRPRAAEPGSALTIWLPARDHDRLIQAAGAHRLTVSALVRLLLQMDLGSKS